MLGNIQNSSESLKSHLRSINYGKIPTFNDFVTYNPGIFLQIIHHVLIDYSSAVYEYIIQKDYELYSKNDYRFMECVYKFLIQEFNMKPAINLKQFFGEGYLEGKIVLCINIISALKSLEAKLEKKNLKPKNPTKAKSSTGGIKEDDKPEKSTPVERIFQSEIDEVPRPNQSPANLSNRNKAPLNPISPQMDEHSFESHSLDDITPMSQLPVKPVALNEFDMPENKENVNRYANQEMNVKPQVVENSSKPAKPDQTKEILKMIVEMNNSFMTLTKKFEGFQTNVESWMKNTNAQMLLLETNFKVLKGQMAAKNNRTVETSEEY